MLVPTPVDQEIDGLRRALGDGGLGRIPSHITLVPPVNVRDEAVANVMVILREAAADTSPLRVSLGPPATFFPDNPVVYLPVVAGQEGLCEVRDRVFTGPLARPLSWPFVPHVTVADDATPERIEAATTALADYQADVSFERVHLLQQTPGRVWVPIGEATFARPAVIGRGGLPVELSVTRDLDRESRALVADRRVVITARREARVVGVITGWWSEAGPHLCELVVEPEEVLLGTEAHLAAAFESWAAQQPGYGGA